MAYRSTYRDSYSFGFGGAFPPAVKIIIIVSTAEFILQMLPIGLAGILGLTPAMVSHYFTAWQFGTYLFVHGGIWHLLFNMFALWMFGSELERDWGTKEFTAFFIITGVCVGIIHWILASGIHIPYVSADPNQMLIGSSGAIFGLLAAYGMCYPERRILFMLIFPMKARYFVLILGAIEFYFMYTAQGNVAHFAHLSGMLIGYLYLKKDWNFSGYFERLENRRRRRHLKLIEMQEEKESDMKAEVDRILDKINTRGMDSLSKSELKILKEASRKKNN